MSHAKNTASLHLLRRAYEAKKQKRAEKVLAYAIAIALTALGSWGLWEHNLWIAIPFAFVLGADIVKSFKEGLQIRLITISYVILLSIGMWFHLVPTAWIAAGLFGVLLLVSGRDIK